MTETLHFNAGVVTMDAASRRFGNSDELIVCIGRRRTRHGAEIKDEEAFSATSRRATTVTHPRDLGVLEETSSSPAKGDMKCLTWQLMDSGARVGLCQRLSRISRADQPSGGE